MNDQTLLADQIAYYRNRAAEYDEWWFRRGRFDRGPALNAQWFADVATVEAAVSDHLERTRPRTALELACGTGLFTRLLAPKVGSLLALDASSEVIELNRTRVKGDNVRYELADLFQWTPSERFDLVFMSFWLSHVPRARFTAFWSMIRNALTPGGTAYIVDSAHDATSHARDHPIPERTAEIVTRRLNDGREYRIVKIFYAPDELRQRLQDEGFVARIFSTSRYFIHGDARIADG